jgi:hypothetical protein
MKFPGYGYTFIDMLGNYERKEEFSDIPLLVLFNFYFLFYNDIFINYRKIYVSNLV